MSEHVIYKKLNYARKEECASHASGRRWNAALFTASVEKSNGSVDMRLFELFICRIYNINNCISTSCHIE